jgi:hypothetical protein
MRDWSSAMENSSNSKGRRTGGSFEKIPAFPEPGTLNATAAPNVVRRKNSRLFMVSWWRG